MMQRLPYRHECLYDAFVQSSSPRALLVEQASIADLANHRIKPRWPMTSSRAYSGGMTRATKVVGRRGTHATGPVPLPSRPATCMQMAPGVVSQTRPPAAAPLTWRSARRRCRSR